MMARDDELGPVVGYAYTLHPPAIHTPYMTSMPTLLNAALNKYVSTRAIDVASMLHRWCFQVFCFLPVCRSGLSFLVHAEFALVSSRQALHARSAWNIFLRAQVWDTASKIS